MRVIYHHRTQATGAEGVHIASVVRELRALGHTVSVVSPGGKEPASTAGQSPYATRKGILQRTFALLSRRAPQLVFELAELAYNLPAYVKLRAVFVAGRSAKPTLLYERYAFCLFAGALFAKRHNLVYLVEVNEVVGEPRVRPQRLVGLASALERHVLRRADGIIVVSQHLKERIMARGIAAERIHVLPNGVDERRFRPEATLALRDRFKIPPNELVVGFVGWFVDWHNLPMLVRTFAAVTEQRPCTLLLVGDGVLKQQLQALSKQLGIADRIVFAGAVPYEDIPRAIASMDVCVIPESNAYRSPIKLFEYMAMGKAVLAPDYEPIRSVVRSDVDACMFHAGDEQDFADKLTSLVSDGALRARLGKQAVNRVLSAHLWRHNAERTIRIYELARARRGSGRAHRRADQQTATPHASST